MTDACANTLKATMISNQLRIDKLEKILNYQTNIIIIKNATIDPNIKPTALETFNPKDKNNLLGII